MAGDAIGSSTAQEADGKDNNVEVAVTDEEVQGRTTGVIVPPPDIRKIADLTATFVAQKGEKSKAAIRERKRDDPNFAFLDPSNPYHTYFATRVDEIAVELHEKMLKEKSGKTSDTKTSSTADASKEEAVSKEDDKEEAPTKEAVTVSKSAAVSTTLLEALKSKPKTAPEKLEYLVEHPPYIEPRVAEIIRLTAQFTAVKGHSFLNEVARREHRNPSFCFVHPTNELFDYFTLLVKHYQRLIDKKKIRKLKERLEPIEADPKSVLTRAIHRVCWKRHEEQEKKLKEEEELADKTAFLEIDWKDFVVVETITFDEPKQPVSQAPSSRRPQDDEEEMDMEQSDGEQDMEVETDDEGDVEIRQDYVPKPVEPSGPAVEYVVLADGRRVRADQVNEVMRVELLDPKWKEDQRKFQERQSTTPFESRDISKNIKKFAAARPDVFGGEDTAGGGAGQAGGAAQEQDKGIDERHRKELAAMAQRARDGAIKAPAQAASVAQVPPPVAPAAVPVPPVPMFQPAPPVPPGHMGTAQQVPRMPPAPPGHMGTAQQVPHMPPTPPGHMGTAQQVPHMPPAPPGHMGTAQQVLLPGHPGQLGSAQQATQNQPPHQTGQENGKADSSALDSSATDTNVTVSAPPSSDVASHPKRKKAKSAEDSSSFALTIVVPVDGSNPTWNLKGQTLEIEMDHNQCTVYQLKEKVVGELGSELPLSRFQLKSDQAFLKDKNTLESHGLLPGTVLDIKLKTRGRR